MDKKHYVTIAKISNVKFGDQKIQIQVVSLSEYSINTSKINHKGFYNAWIMTKEDNQNDDLRCKVKSQNVWYVVDNNLINKYLMDLIYNLYKNQNIVKLTLREDNCNKSEVITAIELGGEYEKQL